MASQKQYTAKAEDQVKLEQLLKCKTDQDIYNLPTSKYTVENILDYFKSISENTEKVVPREKRRYVMYLRKSTDDDLKQVRSLEDQERECLELARTLGISIRKEDILKESASAKKSGNRPIFDKMLINFKKGIYQGLIAWSPDRISRNMKEAGEVIEMIDSEEIQDLLFKTYQFDNTPNGKMLLGILFATSKQYSDKLSVDVSRGISGAIRDGKYIGSIKKGYSVDPETFYFVPDLDNWKLLRKAVYMRIKENKTNQEIADYINDVGFTVRKYITDEPIKKKITKVTLSKIFNDPFYCGIYKHGEYISDLNEIYNFMPLMTPEEFIILSKNTADNFNEKFRGRSTASKRLDFGLLRGKVICGYCENPMHFQRTKIKKGKNKGRYLISYYCRNKDCIRHNKEEAIKKYGKKIKGSIRAKFVNEAIYKAISSCTKDNLEAYNFYIDSLKHQIATDKAVIKRNLREAEAQLKYNQNKYIKYQQLQLDSLEDYNRHHKGKLEDYSNLISANKITISNLRTRLDELNKKLPSRKEFVELVYSYLLIIKNATSLVEEDAIYQKVVLNLHAKDDFISDIKLNPPYNLMVDLEKISLGWG